MEKCDCSSRKKERSVDEMKSLINRLNRIEGQVKGIKNMLQNNAYCTDVLTQTAAVNAAVSAFSKEVLASHIKTCVLNDINQGNINSIDELVDTMYKFIK